MIRYIFLIGFVWCCWAESIAQTAAPVLTWNGKTPGQTDILLCSQEGKRFIVDVSLEGEVTGFKDGSFELDDGAGQKETSIWVADFPRRLEYTTTGNFTVTFSALTVAGQKVSTTYKVKTVKRPFISLEKVSSDVQCLGSDVYYLVEVYNKNTEGTVYTLNYGDDSAPDVKTNQELKNAGGKFKHVYTKSYCEDGSGKQFFELKLSVENECGVDYGDEITIQEKVAEPIDASFTFDTRGAGYACTFTPLKLHNTTKGGTDINCLQSTIKWEWDIGNGKKYYVAEPDITYEEARAGGYKIRLIAKNEEYDCATDTAYEHIVVVERVKADFDVTKDKVCSGDVLAFTNKSTGGAELFYRWNIKSLAGELITSGYEITNGNNTVKNPIIRFDQYGEYNVELYVDNGCSIDAVIRKITVLEDPEIGLFFEGYNHTLDSVCPPAVGADLKLDMRDFITYDWKGNTPALLWSITPADGVSYDAGYGPDTEYPRFSLKPGKTYEIKVELNAVKVGDQECGDPAKRKATQKLKVNNPVIHTSITSDPLPDAEGVIRICFGNTVKFTNHSTGENLRHRWSITPVPDTKCDPSWREKNKINNPKLADQEIKFEVYGDYYVTDTLISEPCYRETKTFRVHVGKAPTIAYFNMEQDSLVCSGSTIIAGSMRGKVVYSWYNNEPDVTWECTPGMLITNKKELYPEFSFPNVGTYIVKVKLTERSCPAANTQSEDEDTIRVRASNVECNLELDESDFCERTPVVVVNVADDIEGSDDLKLQWVVKKNGEDFETIRDVTTRSWKRSDLEYGDYKVTGTVVGYCDTKSDEVEFTVHKDPNITVKASSICPGEISMDSLIQYAWYNNADHSVAWEVVGGPADGVSGPLDQLHPKFILSKAGNYELKITVNQSGWCSATPISVVEKIHVYDTAIKGDIKMVGFDALADVCEGYTLTFTNTTYAERELHWYWSVEDVTDGYSFADGTLTSTEKMPSITFSKYGNYVVKVVVEEGCNTKIYTFPVAVRGIPKVELTTRMGKICQGEEIDMADYLTYPDGESANKNNTLTYQWSVTADRGIGTTPIITSPTADYTKITFPENARYTVKLKIGMKCAGDIELTSKIDVISTNLKASFTVGKDSVGCVNDPDAYRIMLQENAKGESLKYTWIIPEVGWEWVNGDLHAGNPEIQMNQEGNYHITLHVENGCRNGRGELIHDDSVFVVKAFAIPTIQISDIADECETFSFIGTDRIVVNGHNDAVTQAGWSIKANAGYVSEGYDFVHVTTDSLYPDIDFRTCDYQVTVKYKNRCATPGTTSFRVKVDKFIPIEPLLNDAICEFAEARKLSAVPDTGVWTLKETFPNGNRILYKKDGKYYFKPDFAPYEEKDVQLIYTLRNGVCEDHKTMNMHIWPLPHVEAGDSLEMCLNHEPVFLVGKDSIKNGSWQTNSGDWVLGGNILADDYFKAVQPGDFQLNYQFTDGHQCKNVDSTIMTVHPLPDTVFTVATLNCIGREVSFIPHTPQGNRFEWSFDDGSPNQFSENQGFKYVYDNYGYKDIVCRVEHLKTGCRDTSDKKRIEIVNNPPRAFFNVKDSIAGCPPFAAELEVEKDDYVDDHNYLSFHWDYGEGTQTDTLMPIRPKSYPAGLWDTTYITRFTVMNMCDTLYYDTVFTVRSVPKVSFALMHEWECSPVYMEIQNTTTGNDCKWDWTFVNGRKDSVVYHSNRRNPVYEFLTDTLSTSFYLTLKAINGCGQDDSTAILVVKPRSVRAHFTPLDDAYACVNENILFRNNSTDTVASILNTIWDFKDGEIDSVWSPKHRFEAPGEYQVSLTIDNGCGWDTISSPVFIKPLPQLKIQSEDAVCEDDTLHFALKSDMQVQVRWDFGDQSLIGKKDSVVHVYEGYGKFGVTAIGISTEINQCTDSVKKEVIVYNKPIMTILPLDTIQCSPFFYSPEITGEDMLMWDYGDGAGLTSASEHWYENGSDTVQRHLVRIYAETVKGCKSEYERQVTVNNVPRAALDKKVEKGNPQKVTFLNLSEEYTDCIWELPFQGPLHSLEDQMVEFSNNGTYVITLVALNKMGCADTTVLEHEVLIKGLYFPNTFIPHSLNGKINRFNGIGMGLQRYKLEIFDQYNNKIWETRALEGGKPSEGWDGCNMKGKRMPQGIYIWRSEAIFGDDEVWTGKNNESGVPETTQGTVLLLRE